MLLKKMQQTQKIITGWDSQNKIHFVCKNDDNKRFIQTIDNFEWYFAINTNDYRKLTKTFFEKFYPDCIKKIKLYQQNNKYILIYADKYHQQFQILINALQTKNIQIYESDLSMTKRFLIDNNTQIETNLDILYFDIETDDSSRQIEVGRDKILTWAAYDHTGKKFFDSNPEKKLLNNFIELIDNYDIFTGWNSERFDFPYILKRMEKYNIKYNWRQKLHIDMMKRCVKLYSYDMYKTGLTGFSLNEVAKVFLEDQKIETNSKIIDLYHKDLKLLKKYNLHDAELLYKLDQKLKIFPLMIQECEWTGTLMNRFFIGELLDNYILRESKKHFLFMPSRPDKLEAEANKNIFIRGGYVKKPQRGLYDNVCVFDFKSLYPSIIVGWNIGNDSFDLKKSKEGDKALKVLLTQNGQSRHIEDVEFDEWYHFLRSQKKLIDPNNECYQTANNNFFRHDVHSFISQLIKQLLEYRKVYKDKLHQTAPGSNEYSNARAMQSIVKEMANSMFGITGDRSSRYFNKNIAEAITLTGQFLNKTAGAIAKKKGFNAFYGDTDSSFVQIDIADMSKVIEISDDITNTLVDFLNKKFKLAESIIQLEYEKHYKRMIMLDKKRYTGIIDWIEGSTTNLLFSRGTEDNQKSTINLTRSKLIELFNLVLKDNKDTDIEFIKKWVNDLKQYVLTSDTIKIDDIAIRITLSKPIKEYKVKQPHTRLAEQLIKSGEMMDIVPGKNTWGNHIDYIMTNKDNKSEALMISDFTNNNWDREYYWDVKIFAPIQRVLETVIPSINWQEYTIKYQKKLEKEQLKQEKRSKREKDLLDKKLKKERRQARLKTLKIKK